MEKTISFLNELAQTLNYSITEELIAIYFQQMDEAKTEFLSLHASGEIHQIVHLAHKMKSSSRNVGAMELGELFETIEKKPKKFDKDSWDKMQSLYLIYQSSIIEWRKLSGT